MVFAAKKVHNRDACWVWRHRIVAAICFLAMACIARNAGAAKQYVFDRQWPEHPRDFENATAIVTDSSGRVYIGANPVRIFSPDGSLIGLWDSRVVDALNHGALAAIDDTDTLYIYESVLDRIQKITTTGEFISAWDVAGSGDIAVDGSGNVFVAVRDEYRIFKYDSAGNLLTSWGEIGDEDGQFKSLNAIATGGSGSVYVMDGLNYRVQKFTPDGTFVTKWGNRGSEDGRFLDSCDIATDAAGNVYVADGFNDRVQKFASDGTFITKWAGRGSAITVDDFGNVYLTPVGGPESVSVMKYNSGGATLDRWEDHGGEAGYFRGPSGITVAHGIVYVSDGTSRLQRFSPDGLSFPAWHGRCNEYSGPAVDESGNVFAVVGSEVNLLDSEGFPTFSWGGPGNDDGQLSLVTGIALDSAGNFYVVDQQNHRVQKFTPSGVFIRKWGSPGDGDGQFFLPSGLAIDNSDTIYVADGPNNRVQKFTIDGDFVGKWGTPGNGDGSAEYDEGIAVDGFGYVYISDPSSCVIQKFTPDGTMVTKWGGLGFEPGKFYCRTGMLGVAVDNSGSVFVSDIGNDRVQKFAFVPGAKITVLSCSRIGGAITNAQHVLFTVTLSEAVTGVDAGDFDVSTTGLSGTGIVDVTVDGATIIVTVDSGSGTGSLRLDVIDDDSIHGIADGDPLGGAGTGNGNFASGESYSIDHVPPTITMSGLSPFNIQIDGNYVDAGATAIDALDGDLTSAIQTNNPVDTSVLGSYAVTYNVTDSFGNSTQSERIVNVVVDAPPGVVLSGESANLINVPLTVFVTLTESSNDFTAEDIATTNASVANFTGGGSNYSFTLVPLQQGACSVTVNAGVFTDGSNNANYPGNALSYTYDSLQPAASLISSAPLFTTTFPIPVIAMFSEAVTGLDAGDFSVTNGTVGNLTGSGAAYQFDVTPTSIGAITVNIPNGVCVDGAGNSNTLSVTLTRTFGNAISTSTLTGVVAGLSTDKTGKATVVRIDNAAVRIVSHGLGFEQTVLGDVNGAYRFENVPADEYGMEAYAPGYATATGKVTLIGGGSEVVRSFILNPLESMAGVKGIVRDASLGNPIGGVRVDAFVGGALEASQTTFSGSDGSYALVGLLAKGTDVRAVFTAQGYVTTEVTASIDANAPAEVRDVELTRILPSPGSLGGTVTTASKAPLALVRVSISGFVSLSANTDATGFYRFDALPAGPYDVEFSKTGYRTEKGNCEVAASGDTDFSVSLSPAAPPALPVFADVDGNGELNAVDVQLVINAALGIGSSSDCDVDGSGSVDAVDVQLVINAVLGI
jgi:tripartite motif-containing protein 71